MGNNNNNNNNNENNRIKTVILIVGISIIVLVSFMITPTDGKIYDSKYTFKATLTGKEEVPQVDTGGIGTAVFQLDGDTMKSQISVLNTGKVMEVHIHSGKKGENGDVIVNLYKSKDISKYINDNLANTTAVSSNNIQKSSSFSASRTFNDSDLTGPMEGKIMQDLTKTMQANEVYVDVHTKDYPTGEIRGQVIPEISTETGFQNK